MKHAHSVAVSTMAWHLFFKILERVAVRIGRWVVD